MLTKGVGPKSEFDIHQDWSITDETKYKAYNFWIALHDSDEHNGTLYFLPGSHEKFRVIRGSGIHGMFDQVGPSLLKLMKPVAVKKGHAVLFDAAVVHYSPPNLSKHPRISIVNYFTNKNADLLLYHFDGFDTLEIYSVDEKFLLQYKYFPDERNIPPSFGIKIGTVRPFHPKQLTVTDIAEFDNDILIK
jgi:hypothetical protein